MRNITTFIYEIPCFRRSKVFHKCYKFLEPVTCRIQFVDQTTKLVTYGIGDIIKVMKPTWSYCIPSTRKLDKIPLADGSFIVTYSPENFRTEQVME